MFHGWCGRVNPSGGLAKGLGRAAGTYASGAWARRELPPCLTCRCSRQHRAGNTMAVAASAIPTTANTLNTMPNRAATWGTLRVVVGP